jgi:outer membrane lipoprotein-sorting protein
VTDAEEVDGEKMRRKAIWMVGSLLVLLGTLALSACGISGLGAAPKPTATPDAKTILANVEKVQYKDLEFKMTIASTATGATAVSGDGSGTITKSPKRAKISFNLTSSGQQIAFDTIEDFDGNAVYIKFSTALFPGIPTDKWIKTSTGGTLSSLTSAFDTSQFTDFSQVSNATLKGAETVDGIQVWHLTGTESSSGSTATIDFYIRQDNNYPYKFVAHSTGASAADVTVTFTGINTGATVDLPTADQVVAEPTP